MIQQPPYCGPPLHASTRPGCLLPFTLQRNAALRRNLCTGQLPPGSFVLMDAQQLATEELRRQKKEMYEVRRLECRPYAA